MPQLQQSRNRTPPPCGAADMDTKGLHEFATWRAQKISRYPTSLEQLTVAIGDPCALRASEREALLTRVRKANFAVYRCADPREISPQSIAHLGRQLGLTTPQRTTIGDADGIAAIEVRPVERLGEYIPYTNRAINWHTDGYYNLPANGIQAVIMHCVRASACGGANQLLDPEMLYIQLHDTNPAYTGALQRTDAMMIPANMEGETTLRAAVTGPVFIWSGSDQALHMRFTRRTKSIQWHPDPLVQAGRDALYTLLIDNPHTFTVRLNAGEGIISNNVLHTREGFDDDANGHADADTGRLIWRARYGHRIAQV